MSAEGNEDPPAELPADLPVVVAIAAAAGRTASIEALLERLPPPDDAGLVLALQHRELLEDERSARLSPMPAII